MKPFITAAPLVALLWLTGSALADSASDYMQRCMGGDGADLPAGTCEHLQTSWPQDFKAAYQGNYGGQRNVAYCLTGQCGEAVRKAPTMACAWRIVIVKSGDPEVDGSDSANLKSDCGRLSEAERGIAQSQAESLYRQIYGRELR